MKTDHFLELFIDNRRRIDLQDTKADQVASRKNTEKKTTHIESTVSIASIHGQHLLALLFAQAEVQKKRMRTQLPQLR